MIASISASVRDGLYGTNIVGYLHTGRTWIGSFHITVRLFSRWRLVWERGMKSGLARGTERFVLCGPIEVRWYSRDWEHQ